MEVLPAGPAPKPDQLNRAKGGVALLVTHICQPEGQDTGVVIAKQDSYPTAYADVYETGKMLYQLINGRTAGKCYAGSHMPLLFKILVQQAAMFGGNQCRACIRQLSVTGPLIEAMKLGGGFQLVDYLDEVVYLRTVQQQVVLRLYCHVQNSPAAQTSHTAMAFSAARLSASRCRATAGLTGVSNSPACSPSAL